MKLLTPGPLTTSARTRAALDRDWGSRHADFLALSERVRRRLVGIVGAAATHEAIPVQGSGTFAVEAAITTLVPRDGRLLVASNGAYAQRIAAIARIAGRAVVMLELPEEEPVTAAAVDRAMAADAGITDVAAVHCETSSGMLNPVAAVARVVRARGRRLHVDAMSAFGAIPIAAAEIPFCSLVASSNKGLEGVPGLAFVLAEREHLAASAGCASTLSLDLHAQWRGLGADGQWRFTPPVQVVAALDAALERARGGRRGRRPACAVSGELRGAGGRHAGAGIRDAAAGRVAGAGDRDVPRACGVRFRAAL